MMDRGDSREEISQISHGKWWAFGTVFQTPRVDQDGFVFIYPIRVRASLPRRRGLPLRAPGGGHGHVRLRKPPGRPAGWGAGPSLYHRHITREGGMGRSHLGSVAFSVVEVDIVIPRLSDGGTNTLNLSPFRYRGQGSMAVLLGIATRLPQVLPRPPARSKISPPAASHRAGRGRRLADGSQRARDAGHLAGSHGTPVSVRTSVKTGELTPGFANRL